MRELLEQGVGIVIIGGVTAMGLLVRLLLLGYYGILGRACTRFEETRYRTIAYIREDLKRRREREQEIRNIAVYTEYCLAESRILGVRAGGLEQAVTYSFFLVGTSSVLATLAGVLTECGIKTVLGPLFVGGIAVMGLLVADIMMGLREKHKRVRLLVRNYIENGVRKERSFAGKKEETAKQDKKETRERKKNLQKELSKPAEKKKHGKAQEEKRRLTEELLRERRQLEARSFAEQRRREREEAEQEEGVKPAEQLPEVGMKPAEQLQAEAAVTVAEERVQEQLPEEAVETECSRGQGQCREEYLYEALLNEFLKEYPA